MSNEDTPEDSEDNSGQENDDFGIHVDAVDNAGSDEDTDEGATVRGNEDIKEWLEQTGEILELFKGEESNVSFASFVVVKKDPDKKPEEETPAIASVTTNAELTGEFDDIWEVLMAVEVFNDILEGHKAELPDLDELNEREQMEKLLEMLAQGGEPSRQGRI
jgi:hypothetical protein